jgi:hypothetical protein
MLNLHKKNKFISDLLNHSYISTKITIYFATPRADEDYDPEEKNYVYDNLNPYTIRGYVREVDATKLVYKQYGLSEQGAVEILCEDKYESYFRNANKIEINGYEYSVFKEAVGKRSLITLRPFCLMRVVLKRI